MVNTLFGRDISRPEFIALVAALMALNALAIDVMLPALPHMAASLSVINENDRHLVLGSYLLGLGMAQLAFGPLSDRFGRRPPLFWGLVLYIVAAAAAIFAPNFLTLLILRFLQGVGAAGTRVIAVSAVRDRYSGRVMAEVTSLVFMVFMVIPIIAPSIGQLILEFSGYWQLIFAFMAVLAAVATVWALLRLPETLSLDKRRPLTASSVLDGFRIVFTNRVALSYTLAGTFIFGALFSFINVSQQVYGELYGLGPYFPIAFAGMAGLMAVSQFLNARMVHGIGMRRLSHFALIVFAAMSGVWLLWSLFAPLPFPVFFIVLSTIMFMFGWSSPNMIALSMEPLGAVAGTAASVFGFIQTVGGALLGIAIGAFYNGTTTPIALGFLIVGALAIASVLVAENGRLFGVGTDHAHPETARAGSH